MAKYEGLLIRDTLNDTGDVPSTETPTYSPDIICYQDKTLTVGDAVKTYGDYINMNFLQDHLNNIYIRVKNTSSSVLTGKAKAFYAPLNLLYLPQSWLPISSGGKQEVELVVTDADGKMQTDVPSDAVACTRTAFNLITVSDPNAHHCMMGLVTNADGTYIDLPQKFSGNNALWQFLREHPQIAYNNIKIQKLYSHTVFTPVEIGNLDTATRDFVINVTVMEGISTLNNVEFHLQCTDQACIFSYKIIADGAAANYTFPVTSLAAEFSGMINFVVIMPDYESVNALLRVENYAVNKSGDIMEPNALVTHSSKTYEAQDATLLGDFYLALGNVTYPEPGGITPHSLKTLVIYD